MVYTCAAYIGGWLPTTLIVLLASFMIVAAAYMLSRLFPADTRAKLTQLTRTEISQLVISGIIVGVLLLVTTASCSFASNAENALLLTPMVVSQSASVPCPSSVITGANVPTSNPMTYAESYMGYLAFVAGPNLATQIFSTSFQDGLTAALWGVGSSFLGNIVGGLASGLSLGAGPLSVSISFPIGADLSWPFQFLSSLGLDVFLPLTLIGISVTFVQYILLVVIQESAFTILLPIALIMRSLAFSGAGMRTAANGLLALSVAMYIIFPLTVSFDHYAVNWMFTQCATGAFTASCNPSAAYTCGTYQYQDFGSQMMSSFISQPISQINILGFPITIPNFLDVIVGVASTFANLFGAGNSVYQSLLLLNSTAEYFFITSLMFVINLSMTLGFAMSLSRSLNSGVEGAASFWSNV